MHVRTLFTLSLFILAGSLFAQSGKLSKKTEREMAAAESTLAVMLETIYTDSSEAARFAACRDLIKELVQTLDRPNSYAYDFSKLDGLSVKYAPDNSFRIFSWQLNVNRDQYRHYGAIQMNDKKLNLVPLIDRGDDWVQNPETLTAGADNWLGYVVYNITEGGTYRGKPYYFVFGFDGFEAYRRRKVLDVLSFDDSGKAVFGLPVFMTYNEAGLLLSDRKRIIMEYSAEATAALRYDEAIGAVIYENLIMMPGNNDEGPVQMPDGSYHALKLGKDGLWREEERVFNDILEEAPREAAKPNGGRDLLGRNNGGGGGRR